ncbi:MAG: diphthamide synthesis protein [Candidatus Woesearchaeota archaeon]
MKRVYIQAEMEVDLEFIKKIKIPEKKVGLFTTVQFENSVKKIKDKKFVFCGSVLGCNIDGILKVKAKVDAFLFVGSGDFHVLGLGKLKKPIYIANPLTGKFSKVSADELEKKMKGKLMKYMAAKKVGILVCDKPGQNLFNEAVKLQKKLKKESYLFICSDVDVNEFENFPDIDMWINTACPRIEHRKLINMRDLPDIFK